MQDVRRERRDVRRHAPRVDREQVGHAAQQVECPRGALLECHGVERRGGTRQIEPLHRAALEQRQVVTRSTHVAVFRLPTLRTLPRRAR